MYLEGVLKPLLILVERIWFMFIQSEPLNDSGVVSL